MATGTITIYLNPKTVYIHSIDNESVDCVFTVPSYLNVAQITTTELHYSLKAKVGTRNIFLVDNPDSIINDNYSHEGLLQRVRDGRTEIILRFSVSRRGVPIGVKSDVTWSDIRVEIQYDIGVSGLEGFLSVHDEASIYYKIDKSSFAKQETAKALIAITTTREVKKVNLKVSVANNPSSDQVTDNELSIVANANETTTCTINICCDDCEFGAETSATAYIAAALTFVNGDADQTYTSSYVQTGITLISARADPTIGTVTWNTDTPIQNVTNLSATISYTVDPHVSLASCSIVLGGRTYVGNSSGVVNIGKLDVSGQLSYMATVTDSHGKTVTWTPPEPLPGTINIVAYSTPKLTALTVQRCLHDTDHGIYVPNDEGTIALINFTGSIATLNGTNNWTAAAEFTDGTNEYVSNGNFATGTTGGTISYNNGVPAYNSVGGTKQSLSASSDWTITIILADTYSTVQYTAILGKAGGIFSIEEYGVAVGQRSSGTVNESKFESNYKSYFYKEAQFDDKAQFNDDVTFLKDVTVGGDVTVTGEISTSDDLSVGGNESIAGNLTVTGKIVASGSDTGWITGSLGGSWLNVDIYDENNNPNGTIGTNAITFRKLNGISYLYGYINLQKTLANATYAFSSGVKIGSINKYAAPHDDSYWHLIVRQVSSSNISNVHAYYCICCIKSANDISDPGGMYIYNDCGHAINGFFTNETPPTAVPSQAIAKIYINLSFLTNNIDEYSPYTPS